MNLWISIVALFVAIAMHGCSTFKGQSASQVWAHLMADGKTVVLTGCKDAPVVQKVVDDVAPFVPAGTTKDAFIAGVQVAEGDIARACNVLNQ